MFASSKSLEYICSGYSKELEHEREKTTNDAARTDSKSFEFSRVATEESQRPAHQSRNASDECAMGTSPEPRILFRNHGEIA